MEQYLNVQPSDMMTEDVDCFLSDYIKRKQKRKQATDAGNIWKPQTTQL